MRPGLALLMLVPALGWARPVSFPSITGSAVAAEVDGSGPHGVVLVGGAPGGGVWTEARARLATKGFIVISVDLPSPAPTTAASATAWIDAVRSAVSWLDQQGASSVTLIGAEGGGAVALHTAVSLPAVEQVVWLSPRVSGTGLPLAEDLEAWKRPLLLLCAADDASGVRAAAALGPRSRGAVRSETVPGTRVGARLLSDVPQIEGIVAGWLHDAASRAVAGGTVPSTAVDAASIETRGTRYGEGERRK